MSTGEAIGGLALVLAFLGLPWAVGFWAGFRGTWKNTAAIVGTIQGLYLLMILFQTLFMHGPLMKALGGNMMMAWLITFGSLCGAIYARKAPAKNVLALHAGIALCSYLAVEIFLFASRPFSGSLSGFLR